MTRKANPATVGDKLSKSLIAPGASNRNYRLLARRIDSAIKRAVKEALVIDGCSTEYHRAHNNRIRDKYGIK